MTYPLPSTPPGKTKGKRLAVLLGGFVVILAVVLILVFTLGGGSGANTVIEQSIKAVNAGNFDEVNKLRCSGTDSRDTVQELRDKFLNVEYQMTQSGPIEEDGDFAKAPVKTTAQGSILGNKVSDDKNGEIRAKYQDDKWCIVDSGLSGSAPGS